MRDSNLLKLMTGCPTFCLVKYYNTDGETRFLKGRLGFKELYVLEPLLLLGVITTLQLNSNKFITWKD